MSSSAAETDGFRQDGQTIYYNRLSNLTNTDWVDEGATIQQFGSGDDSDTNFVLDDYPCDQGLNIQQP